MKTVSISHASATMHDIPRHAAGLDHPLSVAFRMLRAGIGEVLELGLRMVNVDARGAITQRWLEAESFRFRDEPVGGPRENAAALAVLPAVFSTIALIRCQRNGS